MNILTLLSIIIIPIIVFIIAFEFGAKWGFKKGKDKGAEQFWENIKQVAGPELQVLNRIMDNFYKKSE